MNRRDVIKLIAFGAAFPGLIPEAAAQAAADRQHSGSHGYDHYIKDYVSKMENFDYPHSDDVRVLSEDYEVFTSTVMRLRRLEQFAGHGNFQLMSFDIAIKIGKKYPQVAPFTKGELDFLEGLFYVEAVEYGFLDRKPLKNITAGIRKKDVIKIPGSGNYIFKGKPVSVYEKIRKKIGRKAVLTSGVRGVMKQFLLFLNKTYLYEGNLSLASRSLAPPGYSYHSKGDFDIGQIGYGSDNFTARFVTTDVYHELCELDYALRYSKGNMLGVRYEPWHIKIT